MTSEDTKRIAEIEARPEAIHLCECSICGSEYHIAYYNEGYGDSDIAATDIWSDKAFLLGLVKRQAAEIEDYKNALATKSEKLVK